ncbi:periplasmic binding protein-like I [Blastocladiella britannica]|nr:periplasmic binding protein-like I [Blastocladiella britannica]
MPSPLRAALVGLMALAAILSTASAAQLKFAVSLPISDPNDGPNVRPIVDALQLAVADANRKILGPAGHNLTLDTFDSGDSLNGGVKSVFDANNGAHLAIIGEYSSGITANMALAASNMGMYTCSGAATAVSLSNKTEFPYFLRTIPSDAMLGVSLAQFIKQNGWKTCSIIASQSDYGQSILSAFVQQAKDLDIFVAAQQSVQFASETLNVTLPITTIANAGSRIVLFFGLPDEFGKLAKPALDAGIIGKDWVWVGSEAMADVINHSTSSAAKPDEAKAIQGMLYAYPNENGGNTDFNNFKANFKSAFPKDMQAGDSLPSYAGFHSDCVVTLAKMFAALLGSGASERDVLARSPKVFKPVAQQLAALGKFTTMTGDVIFDVNGDRTGDYTLFSIYNGNASPVYKILGTANLVSVPGAVPTYFSGSTTKPKDQPEDLIAYLRWEDVGTWIVAGAVGLFALISLGSLILIFRNRHHRAVASANPLIVTLIAVGAAVAVGSSLWWIDVQTKLTCYGAMIGMSTGFELVVLGLLFRAYQTWVSFENSLVRKNDHTTAARMAAFTAVFFVQPVLFVLWFLFAPIEPTPVSSTTSFSYSCTSPTEPFLGSLFKYLVIGWNLVLLSALIFFARRSHRLRVPGRTPRYTMFVAQNILFCCLILSPLIMFRFDGFALGSFWVHIAVLMYGCAFTWLMGVYRVILFARRHETGLLGTGRNSGMGVQSTMVGVSTIGGGNGGNGVGRKPGENGTGNGSSASDVSAQYTDLQVVSGRPGSFVADLPVKFPGHIFATWQLHRLLVVLSEGFFGVTRIGGGDLEVLGQVWATRHLLAVPSKSLELVVEVYIGGKRAPEVLVQARSAEQQQRIIAMLSSRAARQGGDHGGAMHSPSPQYRAPPTSAPQPAVGGSDVGIWEEPGARSSRSGQAQRQQYASPSGPGEYQMR